MPKKEKTKDKTYAYILHGRVHQIFPPRYDDDGVFIAIDRQFHPDFVERMVEIQDLAEPPAVGDLYDGTTFTKPPPIGSDMQSKEAAKAALLRAAGERIAALQDAVDLGIETPEEAAALTDWKRYRVDLNRVVLVDDGQLPEWPTAPLDS